MYSWDTPEGFFRASNSVHQCQWVQTRERYRIDPSTFHTIPPHTDLDSWGYVDLVFTGTAIQHGAWKLFSRQGKKHVKQFLDDFPNARRAYEGAVWDAHISLCARGRGMTVTELLRFKALRQLPETVDQ